MVVVLILGIAAFGLSVVDQIALFYLGARWILYPGSRSQLRGWSGPFAIAWFAGTAGYIMANGAAQDGKWPLAILGELLSIVASGGTIYIAYRVWKMAHTRRAGRQ